MDAILDLLNQLTNLPAAAMVIVCVWAFGYILRGLPEVPNRYIPAGTVVLAVAVNVWVGDTGSVNYKVRNPEVQLGLAGVVYWFVAWQAHLHGLKRLEHLLPAPLRSLLRVPDDGPTKGPPAAHSPADPPDAPRNGPWTPGGAQ